MKNAIFKNDDKIIVLENSLEKIVKHATTIDE